MDHKSINTYSPLEEKINIYSHVFGAVLGVIALILFIIKAARGGTTFEMASNLIFCISVITLYTVSALYHSATDPQKRFRLKIFDHSAIYILIAGTYTPYALNLIKGGDGWVLFCVAWGVSSYWYYVKSFFHRSF